MRVANAKILVIPITFDCNMHCPWCVEKYTHRLSGALKREEIEILRRHIRENSYDKITFQGGEPLLYPEIIFYFVNEALKTNAETKFNIYTNATLLTKQIADATPDIHYTTSIEAYGIKGIDEIVKRNPEPETFFKTLNSLQHHTNRIVMTKGKTFAYEALLLHSLMPKASIEVVPDYNTIEDLTESDIEQIAQELHKLKTVDSGANGWFTLMQCFSFKCKSNATWYEPATQTFHERCPIANRPEQGCAKMRKMQPETYSKFIALEGYLR